MSLSGKFARHIETGAIVQIVEVGVSESVETGNGPLPIVKFACECGDDHTFSVEEFFTSFEIVEQVRTATLTASWMDEDFWAAVEELAAEFDASLDYDDGSGPMMGAVMEAEELEGGDLETVERLH